MFNQDNPLSPKEVLQFLFLIGKMKVYSHDSEAVSIKQLCCTTVTRTLNES